MRVDAVPGEPITADKWNMLQSNAEASQILLGGENTRIQVTPHGTLINAKHGGGWNHPWRVIAAQRVAIVSKGLINGAFPTIRDSTTGDMISIDTIPAPQLDLSNLKLGQNDIGWIALELQLDEAYRTIKTATVVQCDFIVASELGTTNPFFFFGLPGIGSFKVRYPLARLHFIRETEGLDIFQVAMFNLNHTCKPPAQTGSGANAQSTLPRHFFWPV